MPSPDVETDIAAYLATQVAGLTVGTNLFPGPERGVDVTPAECTFVEDFGGQFDHHSDGPIPETQLQMTTRSGRHGYAAGKTSARAVHDALALVQDVVINATRYMWIRAISSGPTPIGSQENDSEYFVETIAVRYEVL